MSDTKKPGPKNIQDLKAKLGLKTPGGGAGGLPKPPTVTPPPGIVPPGGNIPAPPGVVPPAGIPAPPGLSPVPGVVPPIATPAPGVPAPPAGGIVAPPGMAPAAAPAAPVDPNEPQFVTGPAAAPVDVDFDSVERKGSTRVIWIGLAVLASLLTMCGGYYFGDNRLQADWMKKSKKAASTTAAVIKKLNRGIVRFHGVFDDEVEKTKKGRTPLSYYNPDLFTKLAEAAGAFDTENPKLKTLLNKQIWTTHYRFVRNAGDLLPRLHRFLSLCQQIQIAVAVARKTEAKYVALLKKKTPDAKKSKPGAKPGFGIMIENNRSAKFASLGKPCKGKKPVDKADGADGYQITEAGGRCFSFPAPPKPPATCANQAGTLRVFGTDDKALYNRLKCVGQEDVVFEAWRYQVMQIQVLLKEVDKVDPKGIASAFLKSAH